MEQILGYDKTNPLSIEMYAQKLIGKTFRQIIEDDEKNENGFRTRSDNPNYANEHENKRRKGGLGEIIEERFFHYEANSDSRPDFYEAGVELKVTPYKKNSKGLLSAKERLVISMIDYCAVIDEAFPNSHVYAKMRLMLLIYYLYLAEIKNRLDYRIDYARLFSPPKEDLKVIEEDFQKIINKIKSGHAHELSEGDTLYLGACTKASSSADRRKQPCSDILAKPRAFCLKNSYMTNVLNNIIIPGKITYEPILKEETDKTFEQYVVDKIAAYKNWSVTDLKQRFLGTIQNSPKNLESMLVFRILGVTGNNAAEFQKAGIVVKTIRVNKNNKIKENMSFPAFKFKELVEEEWEDSTFGNYLRDTRFLFVVYREDSEGILRLQGCQFWNIPYEDLENDVKAVWEKTKQVLLDGLVIVPKGKRLTNNFPKQSENRVSHVRPHAQNKQDVYELPDGRTYPKQCFWLNNSYILSQLNDDFLK
ncbi:MAG: Sau3AI family type II restriction endonuclease [Phascolarctobacterium sp.]|nr:Sau3AI family type II restriction endonuclease [Phascolarctobacterium sp.]